MKKKYICSLGTACLLSLSAMAQQTITGTVKNSSNLPMLGVSVSVVGNPGKATITDENGVFEIEAEKGEYLELVYADKYKKRIWINGDAMNILLDESDVSTENRGVTYTDTKGTQAISIVSSEVVGNNSMRDLSNALYGLIPGLMVTQNTGWTDGATLKVRGGGSLNGTEPLVVVDGIPRDMKYLNIADVETVSVLKDGAATALWGTRGANGVIMVTTKRGQYSERDIDINYTYGIGLPINQPEFVDGYTYARLKNEALQYDGLPLQYDKNALAAFRMNSNPDLYPNVDWQDEALRNHSVNNQLNITFRGGGNKMRYYSTINYKNDYGILDNSLTESERYNSQMKKFDLNARINLDVDITPYTRASLSMFGLLNEENRPNVSEDDLFSSLYNIPSSAFPVHTSTGMWGGDYMFKKNPIAQIADAGYNRNDRRMLQADLRIFQDLSMFVKGLKAEIGVAYDNDAVYKEIGAKEYAYEICTPVFSPETGLYETRREIFNNEGGALSVDNKGLVSQFIRFVLDAKVGYDRTWELHGVNGTLQYRQESYMPMGRNNTRKRQSYIFTGGYNYDNRYMMDVVVNHSGTSVLSDGDKFRTYPAVSVGWVLSNEEFMKNSFFDLLKLRASWGRSGNDNIDYDLDERYWEGIDGFPVGNPPKNPAYGGLHPGNLPIDDLTIELADKYNVGLDVMLLNRRLSLEADAFYDKRKDILITSDNLFSSVIGTGIPQKNVGRMNSKGIDLGAKWQDNILKDFKYYVGGTFSYLKTEIEENGEGFQPYDYLYKKGDAYGQCYGLEAIGYFRDEKDISESPKQMFSEVRPGDIKYKDQNNDKIIDQNDVVKIGYSTNVPRFYYGINLGFEYKGFGIDAYFQGLGKLSKVLNVQSVYWPMRNGNSNVSTWYLEDKIRWREGTEDIANVPRLTTLDNANNFRTSTQWLEDGSYFKLRNLNVYYNLPQRWVKAMRMEKCQVYVRGNNLFSLDHIKYMNCEDLSVNYPDMLSLFFGVNINF